MPRLVLLAGEVDDAIEGRSGDYDPVRMARVRAVLEDFASGAIIRYTFRKRGSAPLKRLTDGQNRTWELRIMNPTPGIRLFGCFAKCDVFVGTNLANREDLAGDRQFEIAIRRSKAVWRRLFPAFDPVVSEHIDDYVSENASGLR